MDDYKVWLTETEVSSVYPELEPRPEPWEDFFIVFGREWMEQTNCKEEKTMMNYRLEIDGNFIAGFELEDDAEWFEKQLEEFGGFQPESIRVEPVWQTLRCDYCGHEKRVVKGLADVFCPICFEERPDTIIVMKEVK